MVMLRNKKRIINSIIVHVTVPEVKPSKVKGAGGLHRINKLISSIERERLDFNLYFITSSTFYAGLKCNERICKSLILETSYAKPAFWAKILLKTFKLAKLLRKLSIINRNNVIISFTHYPLDILLSYIIAKLINAPMIVYVQLYLKRCITRRVVQALSLILMKTLKPYIFVINPIYRPWLINQLGKSFTNKIFVVGNPLDNKTPLIGASLRSAEDQELAVCFISRIDQKQKGILDFLNAIKILLSKYRIADGRSLKIVVAGSLSDKKLAKKIVVKLREIKEKYNVSIETYFNFPPKLKEKIYKKCRVMVLPTYEESWCYALFDALDHGLICVTYDIPELKALFRNTLIYAKTGCNEELAKKIVHAINMLSNENKVHKVFDEYKMLRSQLRNIYDPKRELSIISAIASLEGHRGMPYEKNFE